MMLSVADIKSLVEEPSVENREKVAFEVAGYFNEKKFSRTEEAIIQEIFGILVRDVEVRVRKVLAENLKHSSHVPHGIIFKLATDVVEVALPVLEYSEVLTEDDLISIIRSAREIEKFLSISRRKLLTERVSQALINTAQKEVVISVAQNSTAKLNEVSINNILINFENDRQVIEGLMNRGNLPPEIIKKIVNKVTGELRDKIVEKYNLESNVLDAIVENSREQVVTDLLASTSELYHTIKLVKQLHQRDRLNNSIILRSLCTGGITFFEAAIAVRIEATVEKVHDVLWHEDSAGFKYIYKKANLPLDVFEDIKVVLSYVFEEASYKLHPEDRNAQNILSEGLKLNASVREAVENIKQFCLNH